ncbi:MAG: paraquat-inducible protein A [Rhodopirellula sp.]|nr:paraquat-inducible protein A [Rhodopirellula sp.]
MARFHVHPFETSLAFALTALVPLIAVLGTPFLTLSVGGLRESSTVLGTAVALIQKGFPSIGILVLMMTLVLPMLRLFAFIYVLAPLAWGSVSPYAWLVFRTAETATPWAMLDVFLIGVLVAVIKLLDLASVEAGVGLFGFVALMLLMVAASATLDRETVWSRIRRDAV